MTAPTATTDAVRYRLIDTDAANPLLVTATTLQAAIDAAVAKYSQDRPYEVVEDENGAGSPFFVLVGAGAVLASWQDGFSSILKIEYPAGTVGADYVPSYLDRQDDWQDDYRDASKTYLRLKTAVPQAGEKIRVTYTAPHTHTSVTDTVPTGDHEALYDLAAYYGCLQLQAGMASLTGLTVGQLQLSGQRGGDSFKSAADRWLASYQDRLGIGSGGDAAGGVKAASANGDWDRRDSGNRPWLTHGQRWR